jgi:3',5'-cyclic AMP phosphodiesterase CpdA
MPYLTIPKTGRRDFLKQAGLSLGALFAGGCAHVRQTAGRPGEPAHWALMADTHVSLDPTETQREFVINDNMKKAVAEIAVARPHGAIITGDCARLRGRLLDYDRLWRITRSLRDTVPVGFALGNHDQRDNFRQVFYRHPGEAAPVEGKHVLVIDCDDAGIRIILLDSLNVTNDTPGLLGEDQRAWLADFLDADDYRPTFLFFHHPPDDGGGNLKDYEELLDIAFPRRQVKAIFYGHSHVYRYDKVENDLDLINIPAIGYNFKDSVPVGWLESRLTREGGQFTLRAIGGNTADNGQVKTLTWRT